MHQPVSSGRRKDRWRISYDDGDAPDRYTLRAFATIGYHLWPMIVASKLGGNTYSRCVLTSSAIVAFLRSRGYEADIAKVICDVSLRHDGQHVIPNTLAIGQPNPELDLDGLHVVVKMTDRKGSEWLIDGSTRQAARPSRWEEPPEVMITRVIKDAPPMHRDDIYFKQGYAPLAAMGIDQIDGSVLLFQWVIKNGVVDVWSDTPDGAQGRAETLARRLNGAWMRTAVPA